MGDGHQLNRRDALIAAALLPLAACGAQQVEKRRKPAKPDKPVPQPGELVELIKLDSSIRLDIRYATANNFTGMLLYNQPRAFLVSEAAQAVARAHKRAATDGFGLTIFDGYRPLSVTRKLWDATPPGPKRNYVANPAKGSRHNRGCAVDLSLHNLKNGSLVEMPSGYDEFTQRAHRDYKDASPEAIANRRRLEAYMEAEGFRGMSNEWWHFDFIGWEKFPILDLPFEDIAG